MKKYRLWLCRLAHVTWGILTSLMSFTNPVLSVIMFISFLVYELDEERTIRDPAYQEVFEFSLGLFVVAVFYTYTGIWGRT